MGNSSQRHREPNEIFPFGRFGALLEKPFRLQRRELFGNRGIDKLVMARPFGPKQTFPPPL